MVVAIPVAIGCSARCTATAFSGTATVTLDCSHCPADAVANGSNVFAVELNHQHGIVIGQLGSKVFQPGGNAFVDRLGFPLACRVAKF